MNRFIILFILLFADMFSADSLSIRINELIAREEYSLAFNAIDELDKHISADFWRAAVLITRWNDLKQLEDYRQAMLLFNELAKIKSDSLDLENKFYIAQAVGQIAIDDAQNGRWIDAISSSRKSVSLMEDILDSYPEFIDAKTGIAVYRYWINDKLPFYSWLNLRFLDGSQSIETLEAVSRKGIYSRTLSLQQLFWIYINEEEYDNAESTYRRFVSSYPDTRLGLWFEYFLASYRGKDELAFRVLDKLEKAYRQKDPLSRLNLMEILMKKFEFALKLSLDNEVLLILENIDSMNVSSEEREHLKNKYENFDQLRSDYLSEGNIVGKNPLLSN